MPDIPDRQHREQTIATLLRRAIGRNRQRLIDALGSPPDTANVPDSLWQSIAAEVESDTRDAIALVFLLGLRRMNVDPLGHGWRLDPATAGRRAADYADSRSAKLAEWVSSTYQDRVRTAATEARERMDSGWSEAEVRRELNARVRDIGAEQADVGGATETTAANSAGEMAWRDEYEDDTGREVIATWRTEPGACPICQPLDGTTEEIWGDAFPDGPPSPHANCRCWLEFSEVESGVELEV